MIQERLGPSVPFPGRTFPIACALAGGLAVPPNAIVSPASAVIFGVLGFLGLRVWRWSGLPGATKTVETEGAARLAQPLALMGLGLVVGLLLLAVIRLAIEPSIPAAGARIAAAGALSLWRRVAIIYVAAVSEELLFRLLLLSLIVGVAVRLIRPESGVSNPTLISAANGLSALAFAAVHLPSWAAVGTLTPLLALMVLSLNGIGGVVFGYVFAKRGIVAAVWTHAGADCAIQLIGPLTG